MVLTNNDELPDWRVMTAIAQDLQLDLAEEQAQQLIAYVSNLHTWNQAYNLTAIKTYDKMLSHHIADSLSIARYIDGNNILDVGTGAGLPGIPLAVLYPEKKFTLLDSVGKKIQFLRDVVRKLNLDNVTLVQSRVEHFSCSNLFDMIVARAVATVGQIVQQSEHLLASGGSFVLQKGKLPAEELGQVTQPCKVESLTVPLLAAERHVVIIGME
jgi:16S rRNA (guanine527-N7)-methyltransferase